jgi:hypothetical protein
VGKRNAGGNLVTPLDKHEGNTEEKNITVTSSLNEIFRAQLGNRWGKHRRSGIF